jgi:hypothetical protein
MPNAEKPRKTDRFDSQNIHKTWLSFSTLKLSKKRKSPGEIPGLSLLLSSISILANDRNCSATPESKK